MNKKGYLTTYRKRRDFKKTKEPSGSAKTTSRSKLPIFVIQKHAASHLHFDFRLQIGKVLVSWAVPKGPSIDPRIKRLAIMTEDHPLAYAKFEGTIPEGEYGGGTVMLWDKGTYRNIKKENGKLVPIKKCLNEGLVEIELKGKRLRGGFVLIRYRTGEKNWLLKKIDDEYANKRTNVVTKFDTSVTTGRTMKEIAEGKKRKKVTA